MAAELDVGNGEVSREEDNVSDLTEIERLTKLAGLNIGKCEALTEELRQAEAQIEELKLGLLAYTRLRDRDGDLNWTDYTSSPGLVHCWSFEYHPDWLVRQPWEIAEEILGRDYWGNDIPKLPDLYGSAERFAREKGVGWDKRRREGDRT